MRATNSSAVALALLFAFAPASSPAQGLPQLSESLKPIMENEGLSVHGYFRTRGEALGNLDLDRGLTPSGGAFFSIPLSDPKGQTLTSFDSRLRIDSQFTGPGSGWAIKARLDALDNVHWGSRPEGDPPSGRAPTPAGTPTQKATGDGLSLRWLYGEVRTPVGLLALGRMGNQWGLGMLANGGSCDTCDSSDSVDRIAFITPLFDHIVAVAYDMSASGPVDRRANPTRFIDLDRKDNVQTVTVAAGRFLSDWGLRRRRKAQKTTLQYGAYATYRWQTHDIPLSYLPVASPVALTPAQSVARGYRATGLDGWFKASLPNGRIELEVAALYATVDDASLFPGVRYDAPVKSTQYGAALESEWWFLDRALTLGLDAGFASGDSAPGFGAFPSPTGTYPQVGDLEGPQALPPYDRSLNNFRFHPDYRIDRIFFREILGTVTDAIYVRPHIDSVLLQAGPSRISADLALIYSQAVEPNSTPTGKLPLGIEIDPSLNYQHEDGFRAALEYAFFQPLAALDNPDLGLAARHAHLLRMRLMFVF